MVLTVIAEHADAHGAAFPSVATIAHEANLTERGVKKALAELKVAGELQALDKVTIKTSRGSRQKTRYQVLPNTVNIIPVNSIHVNAIHVNKSTDSSEQYSENADRFLIRNHHKEPPIRRSRSVEKQTRKQKPDLPALSLWLDQQFRPAYPKHRIGKRDRILRLLNKLKPDPSRCATWLVQLAKWKASAEWERDNGQYVPDLCNFLEAEKYAHDPPDYRPPKPEGSQGKENIWH